MKLYHGTCECKADEILQSGLNPHSYLTSCEEIAEYYADVTTDECSDCQGAILTVEALETELEVDYNSYEEPLSIFRNDHASCDKDWHSGCEQGKIPYPKNKDDYKTSLAVVRSVVHKSHIVGNQIELY